MTKPNPNCEKHRPGRPRKPVDEILAVSVPVRLTVANAARLDALTDNRTAFCSEAVLEAVGKAESHNKAVRKP